MATTEKDFMVAIELGSSKVSGIAGKKTADGGVQVLAYASVKSDGCIRHGIISNEVKTKQAIGEVKKKLEAQLKVEIKRTYVGFGGQSLRSHIALEKKDLYSKASITEQIMDSLKDESVIPPYPDYVTLDNIPLEYKVDSKIVADPVGEFGTSIEAQFLNIIAKESSGNNITSTVEYNGIDIIDKPIQVKCLADCVATDVEKSSGCAVVDLGAETTSIIIYKNKMQRYLVVIPLGVATITKDIMSLKQVEEAEAETVKLKYGDAYPDYNQTEGDNKKVHTTADGRNIEIVELQKIIEARTREIVSNVFGQIRRSGLADKMLSGIILAGGGSNMKNIVKLFEEMYKETIKQEQVKVRLANKLLIPVTKVSGVNLSLDNNACFSLLSVLAQGRESCAGENTDNSNLFDTRAATEAAEQRAKDLEAETAAVQKLKEINEKIRKSTEQLKEHTRRLQKDPKNKENYKEAQLYRNTVDLPADCDSTLKVLEGKDKYNTQRKETLDLIDVFHNAEDVLNEEIEKAKKANSIWGRLSTTIKDLLNDE